MSEFLKEKIFSDPIEPAVVREKWKSRGFSFFENTDPPRHERNDGIHASDEILTVVSGKLKVIFLGEEIVCNPGDEVVIPRNHLHSVHNISDESTHWLCGHDIQNV